MNTHQLTPQDINKNTDLLISASRKGDLEDVKRLIPVSDPKADDSLALQWAVNNGHTEIVQLLIPVSNSEANDSQALHMAADNGHTEIVKLLIPVSDPKANNSQALQWAAENGHIECVKLLIPVSDYSLVVATLTRHRDIPLLQQCIDEYEALQQKERLNNNLQDVNKISVAIKRKL